ncbi:TIGR02594 family protein [Labrys sp. KB_33_2]|uniref:NlpC/P60 family protein n=1 Tax=Labrys sp. KB_33_2 TaxID=3237479 RepID=UPI003F92ABE2
MDVLAIQTRLKTLGFDPGPLDGDPGPKTARAVLAFERAKGLPPDGRIDQAMVSALFAGLDFKEPPWLTAARKDLGIREGVGTADNPRVIQMFARAGHPEVKHDSTAWCAAAIGDWLAQAGIKGTGSLWALDYLKWGVALPGPILGAIAVKTRPGGGHVTLVVGAGSGRVYCLGGNQSDSVSIAAYDASLFKYRWAPGVRIPSPALPLPKTISGARAGVSEA